MLLEVMHDKSISRLACVPFLRSSAAEVKKHWRCSSSSTGLARVSASNSHSRLCVDVGKFMNFTDGTE
jgi:hypothetical protein